MALRSRISRQNMRHSLLLSVCSLLCLDISSTNDPYHQAIIAWEYKIYVVCCIFKNLYNYIPRFPRSFTVCSPLFGEMIQFDEDIFAKRLGNYYQANRLQYLISLGNQMVYVLFVSTPSTQHAMVTTRMTCFFVQESLFINLHLPSVCEK